MSLVKHGFVQNPVVSRSARHNRGFRKLHICTERRARVIDALIASPTPSPPAASSAKPGPATAVTHDQPDNPELSARSPRRYSRRRPQASLTKLPHHRNVRTALLQTCRAFGSG